MAKKKTKKKRKTRPITEKEYLKMLIKISEDAISGRGGSIDEYFANQAKRLRKQLKDLEKK